MAFAIVRTEKLKTAGNIGGLNSHLTRTMDVPNADPELTPWNSRPIGSANLLADVNQRLTDLNITPRKNAVWAIEHLMTASPEAFNYQKVIDENGKVGLRGDVPTWKEFEKDCKEWLIERYGKENVVNFTVHKDENTPHIHAVVVPIDKKGKLNCREYLGGREKMRDLQTSFAQKVQHLGLERGIEGSKAKHQSVKAFYAHISREAQEVKLEKIEVKAPEKGVFGIGYKQDPGQLALEETNRINQVLIENEKRLNKKLSEAKSRQNQIELEKNKLKGLKATANSLEGKKDRVIKEKDIQIANLEAEKKKQLETLQKIVNGELTPEMLRQQIQEAKLKKEKEQAQELKNPFKNIQKSKGRGMGGMSM